MTQPSRLDIRRHAELFDGDAFDKKVTIIGAGATGSWLALQLAKLGITNIHVYDFDTVEEHNIPNQLFGLEHVGAKKVSALADIIYHQTGTAINVYDRPYTDQRLSGYVFAMVDSMEVRKQIWEQAKFKRAVLHFIEPRMGLNEARIYNVDPCDVKQIQKYEECWYSDDEAEVSACGTSQSVITTALFTASTCARQLINHYNGVELDNELLVDLVYNNIYPTKW